MFSTSALEKFEGNILIAAIQYLCHLFLLQTDNMRNQLELMHHNYKSANEEIQGLRVALEESRSNGDRLHKESELVVQNVNTWVQEQK